MVVALCVVVASSRGLVVNEKISTSSSSFHVIYDSFHDVYFYFFVRVLLHRICFYQHFTSLIR